jgi:N-acetylmuramoyl-L-alanine amidase
MSAHVGICVGHSRQKNGGPEGGAISVGNVNEWTYNNALAVRVKAILAARGISAQIYSHYDGGGYTTAMRWLATRLKLDAVTHAVELHFNSSDDPKSNGHETLYWHSSAKGKGLAESLDRAYRSNVAEIKPRGAKPRYRGDRGAEFLTLTHCPAVIVESGFGSNAWDWGVMASKADSIAKAIADGIGGFVE